MELNAEQIIKALECCTSSEKSADCPIGCPFGDINSCEENLMYHALSLIKELTEENERLRADNVYGLSASALAKKVEKLSYENERLRNRVVCKVVIPDEKLEEIKSECLERVELDIKAIEADTVRKMQERLKEAFEHSGLYGVDAIERRIDQIAKEIMGQV